MNRQVEEIIKNAGALGACDYMNNVADFKKLVGMLFTPQGREFCEKYNFPSLNMMRQVKDEVEQYAVYVDSGEIKKENEPNICLVGDTSVELVVNDNTVTHKILLMHGAKARIKASNYAVLLITKIGNCQVEIEKDATVVVL